MHGSRSRKFLIDNEEDDDDDYYNAAADDDNDYNDDNDDYSYNSVNFQVRTSRFCMELDLENI